MHIALTHRLLDAGIMSFVLACTGVNLNRYEEYAIPQVSQSYPKAELVYDTKYQRDLMLSEGKIYIRADECGWKLID